MGLGRYFHSLDTLYRLLGHINIHPMVENGMEAGREDKTSTFQNQLTFFVLFVLCFFTTPSSLPLSAHRFVNSEYRPCAIGYPSALSGAILPPRAHLGGSVWLGQEQRLTRQNPSNLLATLLTTPHSFIFQPCHRRPASGMHPACYRAAIPSSHLWPPHPQKNIESLILQTEQ